MQLEVPKELISSSQLQKLRVERSPSFIPLSPEVNVTKVYDNETGITQLRLSNGIPVNYKVCLVLKLLQGNYREINLLLLVIIRYMIHFYFILFICILPVCFVVFRPLIYFVLIYQKKKMIHFFICMLIHMFSKHFV